MWIGCDGVVETLDGLLRYNNVLRWSWRRKTIGIVIPEIKVRVKQDGLLLVVVSLAGWGGPGDGSTSSPPPSPKCVTTI
jgi:hypothetical protein